MSDNSVREAYQDIVHYFSSGCYNGDNGISQETLLECIDSMGKQIPLNPHNIIVDKCNGKKYGTCSKCGTKIFQDNAYCRICGQKIKW